MKVICTGNENASLLTGIHREILARYFEPGSRPNWEAIPGKWYTVYAIKFRRGYPFYLVLRDREHRGRVYQSWGFIPSLCFEVVDARLSRYWRFRTRIYTRGSEQHLCTDLVFKEMLERPMFLENLIDGRDPEVRRMRKIAAKMDAEHDRPAPAWMRPVGLSPLPVEEG